MGLSRADTSAYIISLWTKEILDKMMHDKIESGKPKPKENKNELEIKVATWNLCLGFLHKKDYNLNDKIDKKG